MYRLFITFCLLLGACTTPKFSFPHHAEQEQLHRSLQLCERLDQGQRRGTSLVGCRVWELQRLHLTFPDHETYQAMSEGVSVLIQTWCYSAQVVAGPGQVVWYSWSYQKQQATFSRACPKIKGDRYTEIRPPQ